MAIYPNPTKGKPHLPSIPSALIARTRLTSQIARSWTTQCDLMDRWPNHQFAASSAQQYLWLEQLYPKAFKRVKSYIEKGKFHYVGGAWLEHDCMMPSGESLVRQYLYGQRYFKDKFGSYCREAWLPDTFGYASQLPQILRLAGLNYFFTQKVSPSGELRENRASSKIGNDGEGADEIDQLEQYQCLSVFHLQLVGDRWNSGLGSYDSC